MKLTSAILTRLAAVALIVTGAVSLSAAQKTSNVAPIALTATLPETLTIGLSGSTVNFPLTAGAAANPGSTTITATTSWLLTAGRTNVAIWAYFATTTALTDGSGDNIPSSAFTIADPPLAATALTAISPFNATADGVLLRNVAITSANRVGTQADVMTFNINLSTLPNLPAGSYTGTLDIEAQATP